MRILGIDPGLQRTGWGIISSQGSQLSFVAAGTLTSRADAPLAERLSTLHSGLMEIIRTHAPKRAAIEETFVNVNGASTLKLGQARGALLLTLSLAGLAVGEYSPNLVKKSVVGKGHAEKSQVSHMVRLLLRGCEASGPDAMDALAIAICHAHHAGVAHPEFIG